MPDSNQREVRTYIRDDNGVSTPHDFMSAATTADAMELEALRWYESKYGTFRATEAVVIITNKNELGV